MPKDIPLVQKTAPERIWLTVADDMYYADEPFQNGEEIFWSHDAPISVCVPYVRDDLQSSDWVRAWRNQFFSERTTTYQHNGDQYETARAKAEYDANTFEDGFTRALGALKETP